MKQRPILFQTEMVRAILLGTKTQTRRKLKSKVLDKVKYVAPSSSEPGEWLLMNDRYDVIDTVKCPYGIPGDQLWVREKWRPLVNCKTGEQSADHYAHMPEDFHKQHPRKWKPSIHMPKRFSAIQLEVVFVKLVPLNDITEEEALAEGVESYSDNPKHDWMRAKFGFEMLWNTINGEESWKKNPFVWVVEFKVVEKPNNTLLCQAIKTKFY